MGRLIDQLEQQTSSGGRLANTLQGQQVATPPAQEQRSVGGFLGNVISSGVNLVSGLGSAIIHPIQTIKNIGGAVLGGVEKLIPGKQADEAKFDAVTNYFKQRYGGISNIQNTIYKDPVGFALDLSTFLTAGGAIAGKVGELAELPTVAKAGQVAGEVGTAINPLAIAGKGISYAGGKALNLGKEMLGSPIMTGAGTAAVEEAYGAGGEAAQAGTPLAETSFTKAMRGETPVSDIYDTAVNAYQKVVNNRATEYTSKLSKLSESEDILDTTAVESKLAQELKNWDIAEKIDSETGLKSLDFTNSSIEGVPEAMAKVKKIWNDVNTLGEEGGKEATVIGLDNLKKNWGNMPLSSDVRAFVQSMKSTLRDTLNEQVPAYKEMTAGYREASEFLDELKSATNIGQKMNEQTVITKLVNAMRQNNDFRLSIIKQLETTGQKAITGQIAGYAMSPWLSRGFLGKIAESAGLIGALNGLFASFTPEALLTLATTSPRIMGELLQAIGYTAGQASKVIVNIKQYIPDVIAQNIPSAKTALTAGYYANQPQNTQTLTVPPGT